MELGGDRLPVFTVLVPLLEIRHGKQGWEFPCFELGDTELSSYGIFIDDEDVLLIQRHAPVLVRKEYIIYIAVFMAKVNEKRTSCPVQEFFGLVILGDLKHPPRREYQDAMIPLTKRPSDLPQKE